MEKIKLTHSEKQILNRIKRAQRFGRYDFWFVYSGDKAVNYEGGTELSLHTQFRNQYSLENGNLTKNW